VHVIGKGRGEVFDPQFALDLTREDVEALAADDPDEPDEHPQGGGSATLSSAEPFATASGGSEPHALPSRGGPRPNPGRRLKVPPSA
jgi:hypothetical protein